MRGDRLLGHAIAKGFEPVFNGKDWTGWAGPVDNYEIVDGAHRVQAGEGGTIFTKTGIRRLRRAPGVQAPAGRQQRAGHPLSGRGRHGLRRHVRDPDAGQRGRRQYATLDPRQYHGSAYGMVPAARGYLRPVGEWNFEEVTVKGSTHRRRAQRHAHPRRRRVKRDRVHGRQGTPGQGPHLRATSASPATTTRWRSGTSRIKPR